jgi:hypothetical protein
MGNTSSSYTFNSKEYLTNYPDLTDAGIDTHEKALEHWNKHGQYEGRTYFNFDWIQYLQNYPDLTEAGINTPEKALEHWNNHGHQECRTYIPLTTIINNEPVLNRLLNFNINNKKLQYNYNNLNDVYIPPFSVLIELKNGDISILKENKGTFIPEVIYCLRFIPFYNYLKKINISNITLLGIFVYGDTIFKDDNSIIDVEYFYNTIHKIEIPIFVSSIDKKLYEIGNNIFLIPNFFTYNNDIPINEVIDNDVQFDLKTNKAICAVSNTSFNRIKIKEWSIGKENIEVKLKDGTFIKPELTSNINVNIKEQLNYKYLISMDGCTTAWNGLIWKLYSNSLVIKEKSNFIEYWYFLLNNNNIIEFEMNNMDKILNIVNNNYKNDNMLKEQQDIAKIITSEEIINNYLINLFKILSN